MAIIIIPFGIIFLLVGFFSYKADQKAAREIAHRQIQGRLAEIERQKASEAAGEGVEPASRTRRIRSRR
ncbi:hypothetical protein ACQKH5_08305 [Hyphomonas sp. NPDC076900]|uniref:hypothetical protein n=1 Tax=unclassified Hyphomonas TaxID=2630699 RepID=UPI003CFC1A32